MTRYEVLNVGLLLESPHPKENQSDKLNMKDHSAVSKAISTINKEMQADSMLKLRIDEIKKQL